MPQINQLSDVLYSQLFWLLLTLAVIYFGIGRAMLPKIMSTMDARNDRIAGDLAAAEAARRNADEIEEAYRTRMNESRAAALKVTAAAKQESALATEQRVASAEEGVQAKIQAAETRLREAADAAIADIEAVAAEATRDLVARIAGLDVSPQDAAAAVRAVAPEGMTTHG
jgi:F-type H+-transporting ATPase subunit b